MDVNRAGTKEELEKILEDLPRRLEQTTGLLVENNPIPGPD